MTVKFTNNASTTVATGINTTATSLVVASAAGFPALSGSGDYCYLTIQQAAGTNVEVVKATALSSNTFTIVRAQDGTSAGSWSVSDVVELRVTAALLTDIVDAATHDSSVLAVDSTNNRVGVNDTTPSVTLDISGTDAIALPVGTTAQRPAAGAGRFRYNSSLSQFEGYTDAWGAIGGGGTNTFTTDTFTANGSLVAFNLSQTVASANNLLCFIDGVFQTQDAYSIATASGTTTLTFSAAPANGRKIVVYSVAAGISGTNLNVDSMTGDGSDVTLTLTINTIKENTQVFIDGVYQAKANYSISGTTLTFSTAPPAGSAVECVTMTQTEINVPVDGTITSAKLSGALTTPAALTVTGALAANGGAVFNEASADVDFRVESDANTHALFVDGATGNLGIGMVPPSDRNLAVYDANNSIFSLHNSTTGTSAGDGFQLQLVSDDAYLVNYEAGGIVSFYTAPSGGSTTERMRLNSAGSLLINSSVTADAGGNKLFINSGVNALPATSGTTQTGGALRLRGANNAVLDMGLNSVYTWIQATDKANLANGYSLSLNPNGGNVGIGLASPSYLIHADAATATDPSYFVASSGSNFVVAMGSQNSPGVAQEAFVGTLSNHALKIKTNNTERMRISAEGYVTTPYQPAFDAYHTGGSYSSGTTTTSLDLNTTRLNIGGHYSVSNDRFTAPVAGVYQFNYRAIINGAYTNGHVRLLKNTVILPGADTHFSPTANAWSQVLTQITIYLAVNDYVQVQHVGNTTIYGDNYQSFNGHLIG